MISESLMKVGGWSLKFDPDTTPYYIRRRMTFFSNIIITAGYSGEPMDFAALKARSIYSGLLTRRALRRGDISGTGLLGYLATGKGSSGSPHANYTNMTFPITFGGLLSYWLSGTGGVEHANGLRLGTNYSATATTIPALQSEVPDMKGAIDTAAKETGNEYRVTAAGLVDYGTAVYQTRQVIISPEVNTSEAAGWKLWRPVEWSPEGDVEDYRNVGRVFTKDHLSFGYGAVDWAAIGAVPKMRTWNNDPTYTSVWSNSQEVTIEDNSVTHAEATANAIARRYGNVRWSISCKVQIPAIKRLLEAGDYVYIADALEGIQGTTQLDTPGFNGMGLLQRVHSLNWPVEDGMGVYLVDGAWSSTGAAPTVTDLTPYIRMETGQASSLELGPKVSITPSSSVID